MSARRDFTPAAGGSVDQAWLTLEEPDELLIGRLLLD